MTTARWPPWLRRLIDFLGSGRLAIVLISVMVVVLSLYLLIPQNAPGEEARVAEWLERGGPGAWLANAIGLTDVLSSPIFWAPYVAMFVNLTTCMVRRFGMILESCRFPDAPPQVSAAWIQREVQSPDGSPRGVVTVLRRAGYRTLVDGPIVYGLRGRFAWMGHWVFHVSLLLLGVGGILIALGEDPFRGTVGIGEEELFDLHGSPFLLTSTPLEADLPDLQFRVHGVEVILDGPNVHRFEIKVALPGEDPVSAGINRPFRSRPYQVMAQGFGFMPAWAIANERGRVLWGEWVKLVPYPLERFDSFRLPVAESRVEVRFYPHHGQDGEEDRNLSQELRNPRFETRIVWKGKPVYEGWLEPEQRVSLGEGLEFFFLGEIRKYGIMMVIHERTYGVMFASFGLAILGLLIRYARTRKEILVRISGDSLGVHGRAEMLESLFAEELDRVAERLGESGRGERDPSA
jgi:hypothetical protein